MYYVLQTEGSDEPWWRLEGWEASVTRYAKFETFEPAKNQYIDWFMTLSHQFPQQKTKDPYMAAFWQEGDFVFCEDCGDDLQNYHGLLILDVGDEKIDEKKFGDKTQAICVNCPINRSK